MFLSVNSTAKAPDDSHLYIRERTDDAPRIQLVFVAHKDSLRSRNAIALLVFEDMTPEQNRLLPFKSNGNLPGTCWLVV
jgi:hypothetical protein